MTDAEKLRAYAAEVAQKACFLPMGPERASRFAYALGLEDAASMLETRESQREAPEKSGVYPVLPLRHD